MKVVAFNGSARAGGNTSIIVREVFKRLEGEGIETELVELSEKEIGPCTACCQCHELRDGRCAIDDDDLNWCIERINEAQGVILASPTYFADVTSVMKAFIDRAGYVARGNDSMFRRKVGAALATAGRSGAIHAFDTMNHFFLYGEMFVVGSNNWNLAFGREKGDVLRDDKAMKTMATLGANMAWLLKRVAA